MGHKVPTSACDDSGNDCWYSLWYFWLGLVAALILVAILMILFYKCYTCKEDDGSSLFPRSGRSSVVPQEPQFPPAYEEPGHQPPAYSDIIKPDPEPPPVYTIGNYAFTLPGSYESSTSENDTVILDINRTLQPAVT